MMDQDKSFDLIVFYSEVTAVITYNDMFSNLFPLVTSLVEVLVNESVETERFFANFSTNTQVVIAILESR